MWIDLEFLNFFLDANIVGTASVASHLQNLIHNVVAQMSQ
jgi:hypothetical protein